MLFDWLLCLNEEVVCIWKATGGLNAGSIVYALNRFPLMVGMLFNIVATLPLSLLVSNNSHSRNVPSLMHLQR